MASLEIVVIEDSTFPAIPTVTFSTKYHLVILKGTFLVMPSELTMSFRLTGSSTVYTQADFVGT